MFRALRLALTILAFGFWTGLGAGAAAAKPPVWVVKSHGARIVLFGSIHLLPPGLDWEPPELTTALAGADDVWFEIPVDQAAGLAASQAAAEAGMQPAGQTLNAELSPDERLRLARLVRDCGLPDGGLDGLRPWYADVTLSIAGYRLAGAEVDDGVERRLSTQLPPSLPRRAFETPREQIDDLAAVSPSDQLASLRATMDELDQGPESYRRLVRAWMSGDVAVIQEEALAPMMKRAPGAYRVLVIDRNRRWLATILDRLSGHGEAVMVVGVGHLVGPDGLPAMLRARGFQVEGP